MAGADIPMPPLALRRRVGPTDPQYFDNPSGEPIYANYEFPISVYESVFDFGCGCGRIARQLMQQNPRPRKYLGIDPNRRLIRWATHNLSKVDPNFRFAHHDVYSPGYAPNNSRNLSLAFPAADGEFSLFVAHSVFTHLSLPQAEYYLGELARILSPGGIAFTSWFFFDCVGFPFSREGPFALYTSETDFSQAVLYDRGWFLDTVRRVGLRVRNTTHPSEPGHQWAVILEKRTPGEGDQFPLGEDKAEWLSGATWRAIAASTPRPDGKCQAEPPQDNKGRIEPEDEQHVGERPPPPELFGPLRELEEMHRSYSWRIGRAVTAPFRMVQRLLSR